MATNDADNRLNLVEGTGINLAKDEQARTLTIKTTVNNVELTSLNKSIDIHSSIDSETNTKKFTLDVVGGGGSTPWTYTEDKAFEITVTASEAYSSYFERLVPITSQAVLNSGKDFVMIYQCQVEADSSTSQNIPDMIPIMVNVYNAPNYLIDEMTGVYTNLGGLSLQKFATHGSAVLGRQMLGDGRLFSVYFPPNTLTEGDKFRLTVRAIYIELTGVNQ